jgi:pimeloyl-ACP methyl ester carboxylesterase
MIGQHARSGAGRVAACLAFILLWASAATGQAATATLEPHAFDAPNGETVDAERGFIIVPENRGDPDSRRIELHFVRFKSTAERPGAPIVFLAGGPGGSGVGAARGLFPLFMALREVGDVIALDQRGTGSSNAIPECLTDRRIPVAEPFRFEEAVTLLESAAADCAAFWREQGVDLAGYTAVESARDIDDLRRALGLQKVSLLGLSYGSRLAITALNVMPDGVDRAVLAAVEPPHATIKLPASLDAHVARIQAVIDADPAAAAAYPDIAGLFRRAHARLDAEPLQLTAPDGSGGSTLFLFGGQEMRMLAAGGLTDPGNAALVVPIYAALAEGGSPPDVLLPMMLRLRRQFDPIAFDGMEAMDYTAGASAERLARIRDEGPSSLFGDFQSYEQDVLRALGLADLGEDYRAPVKTDVPTLVLTGTLDGRYDPDDEEEALRGFSRLTRVLVVNGGHNILMQDPVIGEIIVSFMQGEEPPDEVTIAPPAFPH